MSSPPIEPARPQRRPGPNQRRADRSPWNWLLVVPVVFCLMTPLYNRTTPSFLGFPAFYWLQLLFVFVGVASTGTVYLMTRDRGGDDTRRED
jgi:Protein of unknown function (DUF3311)